MTSAALRHECFAFVADKSNLASDSTSGHLVIASHHEHADAGELKAMDE